MKYKMNDGRILEITQYGLSTGSVTVLEEKNEDYGYTTATAFDAHVLINAMELIMRLRNENLILTVTEDSEYNRHYLSNLLNHGTLEEINLEENNIAEYID